jgi:hypothetical protein
MVSATWLNTGIDYKSQLFLGKTAFATLTTRLFTNNHTPGVTDTAASYTECALAGYAAAAMVPANWSGSTVAGLATYTHTTLTFTFSAYAGGTTIYGYFVTVPGLVGVLAELFSTPYVVPAGGGSLTVDVTYEDEQF